MHQEGAKKKKPQNLQVQKAVMGTAAEHTAGTTPAGPGSSWLRGTTTKQSSDRGEGPQPLRDAPWAGILGWLSWKGKGNHGAHPRQQLGCPGSNPAAPTPQAWGTGAARGPQEPVPTVHGCFSASRHQQSCPKSLYGSVSPRIEPGRHSSRARFFLSIPKSACWARDSTGQRERLPAPPAS